MQIYLLTFNNTTQKRNMNFFAIDSPIFFYTNRPHQLLFFTCIGCWNFSTIKKNHRGADLATPHRTASFAVSTCYFRVRWNGGGAVRFVYDTGKNVSIKQARDFLYNDQARKFIKYSNY